MGFLVESQELYDIKGCRSAGETKAGSVVDSCQRKPYRFLLVCLNFTSVQFFGPPTPLLYAVAKR